INVFDLEYKQKLYLRCCQQLKHIYEFKFRLKQFYKTINTKLCRQYTCLTKSKAVVLNLYITHTIFGT
uniref:Uncharacterized protein n=1 Tax=Ciona intestinalis TaxID=7719 RepID=H2XM79_CIOIN